MNQNVAGFFWILLSTEQGQRHGCHSYIYVYIYLQVDFQEVENLL